MIVANNGTSVQFITHKEHYYYKHANLKMTIVIKTELLHLMN